METKPTFHGHFLGKKRSRFLGWTTVCFSVFFLHQKLKGHGAPKAIMLWNAMKLMGHPDIPSGELTFCHGKSPFLMGKSTISMAIFHCYVSSPEGKYVATMWLECGTGPRTVFSPTHTSKNTLMIMDKKLFIETTKKAFPNIRTWDVQWC